MQYGMSERQLQFRTQKLYLLLIEVCSVLHTISASQYYLTWFYDELLCEVAIIISPIL